MAFYVESEHINLNLTQLARKILEQDKIIFSASNQSNLLLGTLINRIIDNYDMEDDFTINSDFINLKDKGSYFKMRLNNTAIDKINAFTYENDADIIFDQFDNSVPVFIKGLLETYARLPFIEREKLVLKKTIEIIENAIARKKRLKITTYNDNVIILSPIQIQPSKEGTFQYIVGTIEGNKLKTIRLSQIKKAVMSGKFHTIDEQSYKNYNELLAEFGPTFAASEIKTIKVRLTEKGISSYDYSVIHRPIHKAIENNNVFVFECSEMQALYFFFRFAGDAEIIEPPSLRKEFYELYKAGMQSNKN